MMQNKVATCYDAKTRWPPVMMQNKVATCYDAKQGGHLL